MDTIRTEIIDRYIAENKISRTEFCKRCGISGDTLKKIYVGGKNFQIVALFKIARVLGVSVSDLF